MVQGCTDLTRHCKCGVGEVHELCGSQEGVDQSHEKPECMAGDLQCIMDAFPFLRGTKSVIATLPLGAVHYPVNGLRRVWVCLQSQRFRSHSTRFSSLRGIDEHALEYP